ncbi:discoidin domain-containing protein [Streptomyces sp. NPDC057363]|uniref:discoidin domain-containing protein n=1 Tax=Streptomyces sp. NPDC057363 TaxID=3346107 RepID=UPI003634CD5E
MTQWHNFAFEWTPDAWVGYVDGVEWFRESGGADADRGDIQTMPSRHLNIQLDNFTGDSGLRPAVLEVGWVRTYDIKPAGEDPTDPGGDAPVQVANVSASADDGNVPANTLDNDLSTRWSAEGDRAWTRYDLGSAQTVGSVPVAWHQGDSRRSTFDVQLSADGSSWKTVLERKTSSGGTREQQRFGFADASARYVRIVGHGNTVNDWTSITETDIHGADGSGGGDDDGDDGGDGDDGEQSPVRTVGVADSDELKSAFEDARAGDRIVLADGTYSIGKMNGKNGTATEPVTVIAENRGKAVVDDGQLEVADSSYVTCEGLKFTNSDTLKITGSNHVRLTRNHFRLIEESSLKWVITPGRIHPVGECSGVPKTHRTERCAYPRMRIVALAECDTHAVTTALRPLTSVDPTLASSLVGHLVEGYPLLADRGFSGLELWRAASTDGAEPTAANPFPPSAAVPRGTSRRRALVGHRRREGPPILAARARGLSGHTNWRISCT